MATPLGKNDARLSPASPFSTRRVPVSLEPSPAGLKSKSSCKDESRKRRPVSHSAGVLPLCVGVPACVRLHKHAFRPFGAQKLGIGANRGPAPNIVGIGGRFASFT